MSKKLEFVDYVENLIAVSGDKVEMSPSVEAYWNAFKNVEEKDKPMFTDNGKMVINYLKSLPEDTEPLKARDIAEELFISARTVSGAARKLVQDGFIDKLGENPTMYVLTEKGKNIIVE